MVRRVETDPIDRDERLGEAIEAYLALGEEGQAPDPEQFAAGYPDLGDDLRDALEGLALVQGLVGDPHGPGRGLESGRRIAGYRIVRELGRGGMGIVYEAVHVGLDRPVALKVLGSHATPDSNGRRRFLNEARTAAGLHHTHIVPVFDVGQVGGLCYYAMQRIEGAGLDRVLRHLRHDRSIAAGSSLGQAQGQAGTTPSGKSSRSLGRLLATPLPSPQPPATKAAEAASPPASLLAPFAPGLLDDTASWHHRGEHPIQGGTLAQPRHEPDDAPPPFNPPRGSAYYRWVAEIGRQAAEALAHAHHRGIVHRDIKPSNLLVDARGIVWVADFGLARRLADPSQTQHDSLLGTPRYMSPEQARIGPIDGRSDVYSLGATLYELLTLRPPFEGRTAAELVEQISGREPVPPHRYDARIPRDLETILLKTLAKRPADRYATATDLADDLTRFLNHEPVHARRISPLGRFWRFTRRHPSQTIVSATAAATVLAVLTVAYVRIVQKRDEALRASAAAQQAFKKIEEANRAYKGTLRELLASRAEGVLHSNAPNRRVQGLDLLQQAARLGPDPALTLRLRDSAVEFLRLADVEARPGFVTGATRGLIFAAEGTRLAAIDDDGEELSLWDVERRQLLARPRLRTPRPANPDAGAGGGNRRGPGPGPFSGGPYIAAVGPGLASILPNGRGLRIFDAVTGEFVRDLRTPDRFIRALYASAGGDRLVTIEQIPPPGQGRGGRGGPGPAISTGPAPGTAPDPSPAAEAGPRSEYLVNLWDPDRWAPESVGQPIATLARWDVPGRSTALFSFPLVAIAPDGVVVATALSRTSTVAFWATADGDSLGEIESTGEVRTLALGPDNLMATAGGGIIQLWDTAAETSLGQLTPHQSDTRILRFHPRGALLAAVGPGSEIELWDPASHGLIAVLSSDETDRQEPSHDVRDVTFSPDGRALVASVHGPTSPAWAIVDPVARAQLSGFDAQPSSLTFRADGMLAVGSNRGAIWFWQTGHSPNTFQQARGNIPTAGAAAAPAPAANTTTTATAAPNAAAGGRPTSLAFDDRGRLLVLDPDALQCWDQPPSNTEAFRIPLPALAAPSGRLSQLFNRPSSMARTPDGRMLFLARQAQILVWRASEPDQLQTLTLPSLPPPPTSDRDRRRFDPGDPEREGRSPGDPEREGRPPRDPEHDRSPWSLSWQRMALAPDGTRLYLVDNWNRVHALALEQDRARWLDWPLDIRARTLALSPDGRTLAIADRSRPSNPPEGRSLATDRGQPGSVVLVDTSRGIETARLLPATNEDEGQISSLAFAPSGRDLAAGTQQGLIDVWSLDHPAAPRVHLPGHRGSVNALAFDPQGRHLASGGYDRTVAVWDLGIIRDELRRLGLGW
jgi:serine/threonine protein kinase/WD40 repeat protein